MRLVAQKFRTATDPCGGRDDGFVQETVADSLRRDLKPLQLNQLRSISGCPVVAHSLFGIRFELCVTSWKCGIAILVRDPKSDLFQFQAA